MSTAKERYYVLKKQTDKYFEGCQDPIHDYVTELEQDLKDSELRRKDLLVSLRSANQQKAELEQELAKLKESQTQKSIIKLCERVDKAEQQVEELKKELQANNMFINEKIKNYNSGYEKLVDIKIGSQHVTKK